MNSGIEIILARMETHPDEFMFGNEKWKFIYSDYYRDSLTESDKGALHDKLKQLRQEEFNHKVMATLARPEEDENIDEEDEFSSEPMLGGGRSLTYNANKRRVLIK